MRSHELSPRCYHDIPTLTLRAGPTGELRNQALSLGEAPVGRVVSLLPCWQTLSRVACLHTRSTSWSAWAQLVMEEGWEC